MQVACCPTVAKVPSLQVACCPTVAKVPSLQVACCPTVAGVHSGSEVVDRYSRTGTFQDVVAAAGTEAGRSVVTVMVTVCYTAGLAEFSVSLGCPNPGNGNTVWWQRGYSFHSRNFVPQ